jgi:TPR repeat protein
MTTAARRLEVARGATVRVCDRAGAHAGQGLLLNLDTEGTFVLTCHHVVANLDEATLCVAFQKSDGALGPPTPALYDAARSHPNADAVVLRVATSVTTNPFLHALNPLTYGGALPEKVTCLGHFQPNSFDGWLSAATRLEVPTSNCGSWPFPPDRYVLPAAFRLRDPSDARPGISGSVVLYEDGVIGLAHFSRAAGPDQEREVFVVPLSVWADGWPALANRIETLVDGRLRNTATVKRARALNISDDLAIAGYRNEGYIERSIMPVARRALGQRGGAVIIGRPKSGKTRIAWQLLQERPDSIVVIPHTPLPPPEFECSTFVGQQVVLFFDDLHRWTLSADPEAWRRRLDVASGGQCALLCTSRDGEDWRTLERSSAGRALDGLGREAVVAASRSDGRGDDFSEAEGTQLAKTLGLSKKEFVARFDGTPGSLTLDLVDMRQRYIRLRDEERGGVLASRLLDAAKLVYEASQPRLRGPLLRAVAERIRGDGRFSSETWETLQRRTSEEGFGTFPADNDDFRTYKPYLENCVTYKPSSTELEALVPILVEMKDYEGLEYLGQALHMRHGRPAAAEQALRAAIDGGRDATMSLLILFATLRGREAETEALHLRRVSADIREYANYACFLGSQPGREVEAEMAFRKAIQHDSSGTRWIYQWNLGNLLLRLGGREPEAEQEFRDAGAFPPAQLSLARLLARDPTRLEEACRAARVALVLINSWQWSTDESEPSAVKSTGDPGFLEHLRGEALFFLAHTLSRLQGREAEAEDAFGRALDEKCEGASRDFGLFLSKQPGRERDAERLLRDAFALGDHKAAAELGRILAAQPGREQEAEPVLRHAIENGFPRATFFLGLVLAGQDGRWSEAERAFEDALAAGVHEAGKIVGDFLSHRAGREQDAERAYRAAIDGGGGSAGTFLSLGDLLSRQPSRVTEAADPYRRAVELDEPRAAHRLGTLFLKQAFKSDVDPANLLQAEELLRQAISAGIDDAAVELGMLLLLQPNRNNEGIELLEAACEKGDSRATGILQGLQQHLSRPD